MDFNKPIFIIHPEWKDEIKNGVCPFCKDNVDKSIMTPIELKELDISGMCAGCQRATFNSTSGVVA